MNSVHVGGESVNKSVTSKEELIEIAREIAYGEGISKLSVRRLAAASGIAIGTVYNYFPSKADLVSEVLQEFWRNVFHGSHFQADSHDFLGSVEEIYMRLHRNLAVFRKEFLEDLAGMDKSEKEKSYQAELLYAGHMKAGMLQILERDHRILNGIWTEGFSKEALVEFTFCNMVMLLQEGRGNCNYLKQVLSRLLYGENKEE